MYSSLKIDAKVSLDLSIREQNDCKNENLLISDGGEKKNKEATVCKLGEGIKATKIMTRSRTLLFLHDKKNSNEW